MRFRSTWFLGVCLTVVACSVSSEQEPAPGAAAATGDEGASAPTPAAENEAQPSDGQSGQAEVTYEEPQGDPNEPAPEDTDAGAAPADAGADASKPKIPAPSYGTINTLSNYPCDFAIDGVVKKTGQSASMMTSVGPHSVSCTRIDNLVVNKSITQNVTVDKYQTVGVKFVFPTDGTLTAVAVGGSCTWTVGTKSLGSSATLNVALPPGTYSVYCKPVSGATKSRSVTVASGETAMAMFKL